MRRVSEMLGHLRLHCIGSCGCCCIGVCDCGDADFMFTDLAAAVKRCGVSFASKKKRFFWKNGKSKKFFLLRLLFCNMRIVKLVFWPKNYLRNLSSFVSGELHDWRILRAL
jgi:uncharacterized membrane protein